MVAASDQYDRYVEAVRKLGKGPVFNPEEKEVRTLLPYLSDLCLGIRGSEAVLYLPPTRVKNVVLDVRARVSPVSSGELERMELRGAVAAGNRQESQRANDYALRGWGDNLVDFAYCGVVHLMDPTQLVEKKMPGEQTKKLCPIEVLKVTWTSKVPDWDHDSVIATTERVEALEFRATGVLCLRSFVCSFCGGPLGTKGCTNCERMYGGGRKVKFPPVRFDKPLSPTILKAIEAEHKFERSRRTRQQVCCC